MRIDRFLHCIRLAKSRSTAQALVHAGHLRIDGKRVLKCAEDVRPGHVIALPMHGSVRVLRVTALPMRRGPAAEAQRHYQILAAPCPKDPVDAASPHGLARGNSTEHSSP